MRVASAGVARLVPRGLDVLVNWQIAYIQTLSLILQVWILICSFLIEKWLNFMCYSSLVEYSISPINFFVFFLLILLASDHTRTHARTHTHTHTLPFNGPLFRTT